MVLTQKCTILVLISHYTTFSDLNSKVLPMKPINLLTVPTISEQCLPDLRLLQIFTSKSFIH